jgi:hypothetical protein
VSRLIVRQYNSIVQLKNSEVNKLFRLNAQSASTRMEEMTKSMHDIAKNTERDTSSMHVVTFLTLIFLPGTFLGVRPLLPPLHRVPLAHLTRAQTFFSTPIFDGKVPGMSAETWEFNKALFILFIKICVPLMCVVMGLWGLYMCIKARTRRRRAVSMC